MPRLPARSPTARRLRRLLGRHPGRGTARRRRGQAPVQGGRLRAAPDPHLRREHPGLRRTSGARLAAHAHRRHRTARLRRGVPRIRARQGPAPRGADVGVRRLRAPGHGHPGPGVVGGGRRHPGHRPRGGRGSSGLPDAGHREPRDPLLPARVHRRGPLRRGDARASRGRPRTHRGDRGQPGRRDRAGRGRTGAGPGRGDAGRTVPVPHRPGRADRRTAAVHRDRFLPAAPPRPHRAGLPHPVVLRRGPPRHPGDRARPVLHRHGRRDLPTLHLLHRLPPLRGPQGAARLRVQRARGRRRAPPGGATGLGAGPVRP